ncbi:MAG TPA: tripartite tricarboxylate transporter substrate binding protein [Candidatus Sulfotelmatobacter sp.]|nr:tripartite tricarboxylate transporter substrate binding protein [Candidatus Sulfotelmatobacter sp.]
MVPRRAGRLAPRLLRATAAAFMALAPLAGGAPAAAQSYPSRAIRIVVAFPPGGTVDILGRMLAAKLHDAWGQAVTTDNRPGAGGNVGAELVAKAEPDGYTLLVTASPPLSTNVSLYRDLPFDPVKDFAPISLLAEVPNLIQINPANPRTPVQSLAELIAVAKAHPGQLNFASQGNGTTSHLAAELLKLRAGIDVIHVPYKGTMPALNDLLAGNVDFMFDNLVSSLPFVRAGKLRALAVGSAARSPALPDVPTLIESGFPGFESTAWFAIVAPAHTPPDIVARLNQEIVAGLRDPAVAARLADLGATTVASSPETLEAKIHDEIARWAVVIKAAKIKID